METFKKSFSILDDVAVIRSNMFADSGITDRQDTKSVNVPNYEPIVTKMRIGIRKTEYLSSPYERKDLKSTSAWDLDICNLIRYGNCKKAYNAANKVHILKENLKEMSEKKKIQMLKTEIQIMLEILE